MSESNQNTPPANTPPANDPNQNTPPANTPPVDDGFRRTLAKLRQENRELKRAAKEAQRTQREAATQRRGKGGGKGGQHQGGGKTRAQGRQRPRQAAPDPRYQKLERQMRKDLDRAIQALPGDRRGAVREAISGMDVVDANNLLRTLGVTSGKPQGVGAFAAGAPKGGPALSIEELRKNPGKIKSLPPEQRRAILGSMGVKASGRIF